MKSLIFNLFLALGERFKPYFHKSKSEILSKTAMPAVKHGFNLFRETHSESGKRNNGINIAYRHISKTTTI